ncbi:MAG TPA: hypothetical protein VMI12_18395 [Puia sp.]|nr:hypothetical protein [Puia sp.]
MIQLSFIVAGIVLIAVTYFSAKEVVPHLSKKEKILFFISLALLGIIPPLQYFIQNLEDQEKELNHIKEEDERANKIKKGFDSSINIITKNYDNGNLRTTSTITDILGKYGYALDATNKRLIKLIKDSSKTKIIETEAPVLMISNLSYLKHENNRYHYQYDLVSSDASSSNYELLVSTVLLDSANTLIYGGVTSNLFQSLSLSKGAHQRFFFNIDDIVRYNYLYIWIRGKYTNADGNKTYHINEVYFHNKSGNNMGMMQGDTRNKVISVVKSNETN